MSTRSIVVVGGVAAALLVAVSVAILLWLERRPAAGPDAAAVDVAAVPPAGAVVPVVAPPPPPADAPPEPPVLQGIRAHPRAAASVAWDDVPAAARLSDLGPVLAAPVNAAIRAARAKMDLCFEEDARLAAARPAPVSDTDGPLTGPAILVIRLESREGALDIVDTEVETRGTSTRELVQCARTVLKGWPIEVQGVKAGTRYRLKYVLM